MRESKDMEKLLVTEWALEALKLLPQERKEELILFSLERQLYKQNFGWEAQKVFQEYAMHYAAEHLAKPEFQDKIKTRTYEAVEEVFDKLLEEFTKQFASKLEWAAKRAASNFK